MKSQHQEKERIVICGIGNRARGDDGVGPVVIEELNKTDFGENIMLIDCETAPENFTGMINKFRPKRIVIIDAVDMEEKPGTIKTIDTEKIKGQFFSTHKIPVFLFIQYLKKNLPKSEIIFLGIQPKDAGFNKEISKECMEAVAEIKNMVLKIINITMPPCHP